MQQSDRTPDTATPTPESRALSYEPPKLLVLGAVAELTQAHCVVDEHGRILCFST